jgi:hypothetical protein
MKKLTLLAVTALTLTVSCTDEVPLGETDSSNLLRISDNNAQGLLLASLEFDDISPDLDFLEVSPNSSNGSRTEQCESGSAKVTAVFSGDIENRGFSFDGSMVGTVEFDDCLVEGQTYNGIIENDIVFDNVEIIGFEATGLVSVAVLYDEFEVTSNDGEVSFDGQVKVVEDFTNMEMRLSWDIIAATENQEKPIRSHTDEDIVVDLSLGSYMSGSWVIEGSDDSSINAYFDSNGNGLEYSVNGADSQLIPWSDL